MILLVDDDPDILMLCSLELRSAGFDVHRLPAIAVTAFSRVQDRADAMAAGFQAHLAKPVKAEALIGAVANLARKT